MCLHICACRGIFNSMYTRGAVLLVSAIIGGAPIAFALDKSAVDEVASDVSIVETCPETEAVAVLSTQEGALESFESVLEIDEYRDSAKTAAAALAHTPSCSEAGGHRVCASFPFFWPCMCGNRHLSKNLRKAGCTCVISENGGQQIHCPAAQ